MNKNIKNFLENIPKRVYTNAKTPIAKAIIGTIKYVSVYILRN